MNPLSDQDFNAAVERVASRYLASQGRTAVRGKTAGEVRFIKDRGADKNEWGWGSPGPSERQITSDYEFNPTRLKPLAQCLRGTLAALGHAMSAYTTFTKIKSAQISPDGNLGGRGYIAKIADMRRQYMNVTEALSALSDTIYDEMNAPHWNPAVAAQSPREREEVLEIMEDVEDIKGNPEGWAEDEEAEMDANGSGEKQKKTASAPERLAQERLALRFLARGTT